jgi:Sulfotransferase family
MPVSPTEHDMPSQPGTDDPLVSPIFVVAPPRAGSRLIARALRELPEIWTASGKAGALLSCIPDLDPPDGRRAGRLLADDCREEVRDRVLGHLRAGGLPRRRHGHGPPRLFDASPRNALIVPFLEACFPDARFVYVHRAPVDALAESFAVWRAGTARTYPALPGWTGPPWSFLLVPGWQDLIGRPLAEIVTEQWVRTMRLLLADLERLSPRSWCVTDHDTLLTKPRRELARVLAFLSLDAGYAAATAQALPGRPALSAAQITVARRELGPYLARTEDLAARARDWIAIGPA